MTWCGTRRTRITWSIGSTSPNSCCATVWPITATLAEPACSTSSKLRPASSGQSRTSRYSGRGAEASEGAPVGVGGHHLRAGARAGRGGLHLGHVGGDGACVLRSGLAGLRAQAHAAAGDRARQHQHDVGAQAFICSSTRCCGAAADGDHGDHRGHADDDAQHRQGCCAASWWSGTQRRAARPTGSCQAPVAAASPAGRARWVGHADTVTSVCGCCARSSTMLPVAEHDAPPRPGGDVGLVRDHHDGHALRIQRRPAAA